MGHEESTPEPSMPDTAGGTPRPVSKKRRLRVNFATPEHDVSASEVGDLGEDSMRGDGQRRHEAADEFSAMTREPDFD
ncbi:MAG: hypothetical protein M0026_02810 [Nocardiopsaceae bacterium]|nr:hypothetical protein [Nocardiopsaceae bacterium]